MAEMSGITKVTARHVTISPVMAEKAELSKMSEMTARHVIQVAMSSPAV
jgi:hypothetical protein